MLSRPRWLSVMRSVVRIAIDYDHDWVIRKIVDVIWMYCIQMHLMQSRVNDNNAVLSGVWYVKQVPHERAVWISLDCYHGVCLPVCFLSKVCTHVSTPWSCLYKINSNRATYSETHRSHVIHPIANTMYDVIVLWQYIGHFTKIIYFNSELEWRYVPNNNRRIAIICVLTWSVMV